jgi:hypothetical protein
MLFRFRCYTARSYVAVCGAALRAVLKLGPESEVLRAMPAAAVLTSTCVTSTAFAGCVPHLFAAGTSAAAAAAAASGSAVAAASGNVAVSMAASWLPSVGSLAQMYPVLIRGYEGNWWWPRATKSH